MNYFRKNKICHREGEEEGKRGRGGGDRERKDGGREGERRERERGGGEVFKENR